MLRTLREISGAEMLEEFSEQIESFRRSYLVRLLALLAATAWAVGMVVLFVRSSGGTVATLLGFELLCWVCYRLCRRKRLRWAQSLLMIGLAAWLLGLVWLAPHPVLLFLPVLAAPVAVAVLEIVPAALFTGLLVIGQVVSAYALFPETWFHWQMLLAPLLTLEAALLALVWSVNLYTVLGWAVHSTRTTVERLEEVQEHRAQLHGSLEELDAAYRRLERTNEMLIAARAEAEAARQARNQFALTVSHELRTPLGFIIGFSELMVNSPGIYAEPSRWPPGLYEDIQEIYHNSTHLMRLVNDILELGQAEARRLVLTKEWIAPGQIVQETEAIMGTAIAAQQLYFRLEVEPDLPDLFVDRTRLRQVLINLISNSQRFTEKGGITVSVRRRETDVLFVVEDTGAGIPADDIPKVFEAFGQASATVWRRRGGSGLGVPISRRFVEMHGGRMWLESQVGQGTTFFFTLPLPGIGAELPAGTFSPDDEGWRLGADHERPPRVVLVLSPDPEAGQLVERFVNGHRVMAVDPAGLAAQHLANLLPQVLIVDRLLMAEPAVTTLIQSLPVDLPVIILDLPGSPGQVRPLPPGVRDHLVKPVRQEDLVVAIHNLAVDVRSLLVIDDDPAMSRFVSLALAAARQTTPVAADPIRLFSAFTGHEALERLKESGSGPGAEPPNAILLDLKLPDMSGWDILTALHESSDWRHIPVILVTAADLHEVMDLRERKLIQVSTGRSLTPEEVGIILPALLQSVQPRYPPVADGPERPKDPSV